MTQLDQHTPRTVSASFASPTDVDRYGEYRITREPGDDRPLYRFNGRITADGSSGFRADKGRYHLYAGWFCPYAQRAVIALKLAGLDDIVSVSYVDGTRDARGWAFRETYGPDPVNGFTLLRDAYEATEPGFDGHVSVPTLWDRVTNTVVSNDFRGIGIDFATQFRAFAEPAVDTYPDDLADAIEDLDRWIGTAVTQGIAAAAGNGPDAPEQRRHLLDTFALVDRRLARQRYLLGDRLTEADIRLYVALVRYDLGANAGRAINTGLDAFPHLWAYARDIYSIPEFKDTTDFTTYGTLAAWRTPPNRGDQADEVA
ncbi:MAG: glutathione S-transferase C-terminal domain-containing protein [Actinobacteria bacterium]|nr:glutathione S-transferase C-terminal domain-containing protein [Actinomycetota bacterium]